MIAGALAPYELALQSAQPLQLRSTDGGFLTLDVGRWLAASDDVDATVIARCAGPVLDIGCGPGRFVATLSHLGIAALGVDIAQTAVELTRGQGLPAIVRNIFDAVPGEGRWPTVLLMDGNIGIGGDPLRLLTRVRSLMAPHGHVIVETHPVSVVDEIIDVQFAEAGRASGPVFSWSLVGDTALRQYGSRVGLDVSAVWSAGGRRFTSLAAR